MHGGVPETPSWLAPLRALGWIPEWVPDAVPMSWFVILLLTAVCYLGTRHRRRLPTGLQNFLELAVEGLGNLMEGFMGRHTKAFLPFIGTLFIYILVMNMFGMIPGMKSPTANVNTNAAMAIIVFCAVQYYGFKTGGLRYLKHFTGDVPVLAPLMVVVHGIGELARPLSLTIRLFGNIMGEDLVVATLLLLSLPLLRFLGPLPESVQGMPLALSALQLVLGIGMMGFALFTSVIQAMVFSALSAVYISGAMAGEEH
jgi:F-type H+-transporting ATPase subunit a